MEGNIYKNGWELLVGNIHKSWWKIFNKTGWNYLHNY